MVPEVSTKESVLLTLQSMSAVAAPQSKRIRRGLLAIAVAATVMPVLPLVLVPANSRCLSAVQ